MKIEAPSITAISKKAKEYLFPQDHVNDPYPNWTHGEISNRRPEVKLKSFEEVLKHAVKAKSVRIEVALLIDPSTKSFIEPRLSEGSRFVVDDGENQYTFLRPYSPHTLNPSLEALKRRSLDMEAIKEVVGDETVIVYEQNEDAQWQKILAEHHRSIPPSEVFEAKQSPVAAIQETIFPLRTVRRIPRTPVAI